MEEITPSEKPKLGATPFDIYYDKIYGKKKDVPSEKQEWEHGMYRVLKSSFVLWHDNSDQSPESFIAIMRDNVIARVEKEKFLSYQEGMRDATIALANAKVDGMWTHARNEALQDVREWISEKQDDYGKYKFYHNLLVKLDELEKK